VAEHMRWVVAMVDDGVESVALAEQRSGGGRRLVVRETTRRDDGSPAKSGPPYEPADDRGVCTRGGLECVDIAGDAECVTFHLTAAAATAFGRRRAASR
jgi:hypothetical protein